jgi:hypothetical protein
MRGSFLPVAGGRAPVNLIVRRHVTTTRPSTLWLTAGLLPTWLSACASLVYSGDGHLQDKGPLEGLHRYVVDLGAIDLREPSTHSYVLRGLPDAELKVGFDVILDDQRATGVTERPINSVVDVRLQAPDKSILIHEHSSMNTWGWAERTDEPNIRFVSRTAFRRDAGGSYALTVQVVEPDSGPLQYRTRLVLKGGGWQE